MPKSTLHQVLLQRQEKVLIEMSQDNILTKPYKKSMFTAKKIRKERSRYSLVKTKKSKGHPRKMYQKRLIQASLCKIVGVFTEIRKPTTRTIRFLKMWRPLVQEIHQPQTKRRQSMEVGLLSIRVHPIIRLCINARLNKTRL